MLYKIKIQQQRKALKELSFIDYLDARTQFQDIASALLIECLENDDWYKIQLIDNDITGSVIMTRQYPDNI